MGEFDSAIEDGDYKFVEGANHSEGVVELRSRWWLIVTSLLRLTLRGIQTIQLPGSVIPKFIRFKPPNHTLTKTTMKTTFYIKRFFTDLHRSCRSRRLRQDGPYMDNQQYALEAQYVVPTCVGQSLLRLTGYLLRVGRTRL